jgi:thioredoxin-related protein
MKNIFFFLTLTLFPLMQQEIYAQGIQFEKTSWEEILKKASDENKVIFMDAYAVWCGPCKMMDKNVFSDPAVGEYFNKNFVNAKIDMEKGEGIALSQKYGVRAYPTFLFIDAEGELVHRAVGLHSIDDFINVASVALDQNKNLGGLEKRYKKGDRDPDLLYELAMARADAYDPSYQEIVDAYLETQRSWNTEKNMEFIFRFAESPDSPLFAYIMENRAAFEEHFGAEQIGGLVRNAVMPLIYEQENEQENLAMAERIFQQFDPENGAEMALEFKMYFYQIRQMNEEFAQAAIDFYGKKPEADWETLNQIAWSFYELVENKDQLKVALGWAEQSVAIERNYFNVDTLAALHYKLGNKKPAMKLAKEAIKLAKAAGEDPGGSEELLKNIKAM